MSVRPHIPVNLLQLIIPESTGEFQLWNQHVSFTCMSLDSVTLLISMGLGLKAEAPSNDSCGRKKPGCHLFTQVPFCLNRDWHDTMSSRVPGWPAICVWTCCEGWRDLPLCSCRWSSPTTAWSSKTLWRASSTSLYPETSQPFRSLHMLTHKSVILYSARVTTVAVCFQVINSVLRPLAKLLKTARFHVVPDHRSMASIRTSTLKQAHVF